jgi:crotonobetainyl-CoA:carnitine CoA-transferase CaiB-like acyl-CoA transferase
MSEGVLSGIRVIDAGTYIAGPSAATVLSDFGAEVIKIERPPAGDPYRQLHQLPGMPVSDQDYCWMLDARNKRSLALDLNDPEGREILLRLAAQADVFVTNYQPQLVRKFRLGYDVLREVNPRIIYAGVTGYGETGEEAEKAGFDATAYWARSGLMGIIHNADAEPARSPAGMGDHPTAMTLFGAIMLALYRRERTGQGGKVTTSLMANGLWSNACTLQAALVGAAWPVRTSRRDPLSPLVNHYVTSDGKRFLLCLLDQQREWPRLCAALGRPELADDERFAGPDARAAHRQELVAILDAAIGAHPMAQWKQRFAEQDILWGAVSAMDDLPDDPQLEAAGVITRFADGQRTITNPIRLEGEPQREPQRPPAVGEHSAEILRSLGLSADRIAALAERGVTRLG